MSIRLRLTLWSVLLLGIVLIVFSTAFYGVLYLSLNTAINVTLQERAKQVGEGFRGANNPAIIIKTGRIVLPEIELFSSDTIYIQVVDAQGQVVKRSRNLMGYTLPINQEIVDTVQQGQSLLNTFSAGNIAIRLYSIPIQVDQQTIGIVQVAKSLEDIALTLKRVSLLLIGGTIVALATTAIVGALLARMSLRSIDQITLAANQIFSGRDLRRRLPVSGNQDEIDRLSQTINDMLQRLDNFFQAQVRLGADISHELRTPLTIIKGNIDLLRYGHETSEERMETIVAIDSALTRMSRLVSDLLLLSQADAGLSLTMRTVDLEELMLDVFQQVHALSNGVNLNLGHIDPVTINGDADRLKQLLINLMDNAIKHTPEGGYVTLSMYKSTNQVRIAVADTGQGISPENLPHIFDRFYRVKGQPHKGTGLGLAIAKWISEAHLGSLEAESELGNGSTFTLTLPLTDGNNLPSDDTRPLSRLRPASQSS